MAKQYQTPGVYIEEISGFTPPVVQAETSIPIFIGYTRSAESNGTPLVTEIINGIAVARAQRITSLLEYEAMFGIDTPPTIQLNESYAADKLTLISRDITINANTIPTLHNHMQLYFANGGGACYVVSAGNASAIIAAENLLAGLEMAARYDEPSLVLIPQASQLPLVTDYGKVCDAALLQAATLQDRFVLVDCYGDDPANLRNNTGMANLQYGAAYHPFLQSSCGNLIAVGDPSVNLTLHKTYADGSEDLTDVNFADLPAAIQALVMAAINKPNLLIIPPCSAIAGMYAMVDSARGVWAPPANESLNLVFGLTKTISDAEQDTLNVDPVSGKSINAIRAFTGRGILVWGARTLAGNDNDWRYISVRRLFIMVEESVKSAVAAFVFQPNDANTWTTIQSMLANFLTQLWREGALLGPKPEQAFFVKIGLNETMTSTDILNGKLNIEIGMAAARPAEFIIIQITQLMQQC